MPYIDQLNIKGIAAGFGAFIGLYLLFIFLINSLIGTSQNIEKIQPIITYGGYFIWIVSGYVAGFFSRKSGIINGGLAGILTPIVMIIYMIIGFGSWEHVQETVKANGIFWLLTGFLLCGFGGLIWDIQNKVIKK